MPKKPNELKAKARELYEQGYPLVEIAQIIGVSAGTVRGWKSKDKKNGNDWDSAKPENVPKNVPKRSVPEASLANLRPPFEPGNKAAEKHGLYSDHSNDPDYEALYQETLNMSEEELTIERIADRRANYILASRKLDKSNPVYWDVLARVDTAYGNLLKKLSEIRATSLDNEMRRYRLEEYRQQVTGNSPELELLDRYIQAVELDAARDAEFDNEEISDS